MGPVSSAWDIATISLLGVVIDPDLFAETVIPESIHNMHDGLFKGFITHHDRTIHSLMPGRMYAVINRQGQINGRFAGFFLFASDRFRNPRNQKRIKGTDRMQTVVFSASDRNNDDIVFSAVCDHFFANCVLDVRAGFI